jgi:hypothetical protein
MAVQNPTCKTKRLVGPDDMRGNCNPIHTILLEHNPDYPDTRWFQVIGIPDNPKGIQS